MLFGPPSLDLALGLDRLPALETPDLVVGKGCGSVAGSARRRAGPAFVGSRRVWVVVRTRVELGRRRHWRNWCWAPKNQWAEQVVQRPQGCEYGMAEYLLLRSVVGNR